MADATPLPDAPRWAENSTREGRTRSLHANSSVTPHYAEDGDSAEADILSRITRSLSVSVEHKHAHDAERRLSQRAFSLRDIESELAAASQYAGLDGTHSVDSDNSTVAINQPSHTSVREPPGTSDRSWDPPSRRSPAPGIGFGGAGTGYKSGSPVSGTGEHGSHFHVDTDYNDYAFNYGSDNVTPLAGEPATARFNSYEGDRDSYAASESGQSDAPEEPAMSAEEMYNRLKSATLHGHASTLSTHPYGGDYGAGSMATSRVLKPSSTTLQLGLRKGTLNNPTVAAKNEKSLVGKSASERLHNAAELDRNKRERRSKYAAEQEVKKLEQGKFKLNANSQKIVANLRPRQYQHVHVGERLYEEGLVEKELKVKRADELKDKLTPEEWSCARCGTFQKVVNTAIVIQPLHQMQSKARILNNAGEDAEKPRPVRHVCKECGWDQDEVPAHKPVNIALTLSDEADTLLRSRWQGNQPNPQQGGIHQYLYENARTRENIQQLNRVLWNEAHSGLTFAPALPESTIEILEKYKATAAAGEGPDNYTQPPVGLGGDKTILAGPVIGEYFSKSATERLSTTQTRPVLSAALKSYHTAGGAESESRASTLNPAHQEQFVNRLVYEYKDKRQRQQKATAYATNHDVSTGEELFKPQVGPDPAEALGTSSNRNIRTQKGSVFENIMEKDRILKLRKKEAEDRAAEALSRELQSNQVKALDASQQILQQSTESNVQELFQVLLEAQEEIIQDANAKQSGDGGEGASPDWRTLLLDLDQINSDLLIPEVGILINEVRAVKINELNTGKHKKTPLRSNDASGDLPPDVDVPNMLVSFASFRKLVLKCMKRRDGTGRSYVYVPKKKPDMAMQMIQEKLKEETFRPTIDRNSAALCMRRHKDLSDYPIEDLLQVEGERIRHKWESARQERILEASKELTFKPKLFKAPSYVKPKYWGTENQQVPEGSDSESEERKGEEGDVNNGWVDESSMVSSDAEQQVVQMPALQSRPAAARTHSDGHARQESPTGRRENAERHARKPASKGVSPNRDRGRTSDKVSPTRGTRGPAPPLRVSISPLSRGSDDQSINTISTRFTADEPPPPPSLPVAGRSVDSAAPLVTRRNPTSSRKSSTGPGTPASVTRTSSLASSNARRSASGAGSTGKPLKTPGAAPPPLPIDIAQSSRPLK
jgi:hypothetical protein